GRRHSSRGVDDLQPRPRRSRVLDGHLQGLSCAIRLGQVSAAEGRTARTRRKAVRESHKWRLTIGYKYPIIEPLIRRAWRHDFDQSNDQRLESGSQGVGLAVLPNG